MEKLDIRSSRYTVNIRLSNVQPAFITSKTDPEQSQTNVVGCVLLASYGLLMICLVISRTTNGYSRSCTLTMHVFKINNLSLGMKTKYVSLSSIGPFRRSSVLLVPAHIVAPRLAAKRELSIRELNGFLAPPRVLNNFQRLLATMHCVMRRHDLSINHPPACLCAMQLP